MWGISGSVVVIHQCFYRVKAANCDNYDHSIAEKCTHHWRIQGGCTSSQSNFFHFHAVFGKNWLNNRFSPPNSGVGSPSLGNPGSAIAHARLFSQGWDGGGALTLWIRYWIAPIWIWHWKWQIKIRFRVSCSCLNEIRVFMMSYLSSHKWSMT